MWFIGLVLAAAGMAIALASDWLIERLPDAGDNAVNWLKPWAWHLFAFGLGGVVLGLF